MERHDQHHPNPQIYEQLATVLKRRGDKRSAVKRVHIEKEDKRKKNWFLKWTVGYGHAPLRIIYWAVSIILIGTLLFHTGNELGLMVPTAKEALNCKFNQDNLPPYYPKFVALIYSLEVFFPIVKLNQQEEWQPSDRGRCVKLDSGNIFEKSRFGMGMALRIWYWIETGLGWICATLAITGITGLIRKS